MTNPEWKPQPSKPAMTRDGKTLVTDLVCLTDGDLPLWSPLLSESWSRTGRFFLSDLNHALDLIEPTAAILAAHGIDANGKPVAKGQPDPGGLLGEPKKEFADSLRSAALANNFFAGVDLAAPGGDETVRYEVNVAPSAPAPSTRVDDRWFQAACAALNGLTAVSYDRQEEAPIGHVRLAAEMADALMAEVAKREGR